jgi:hypothetical protein
MQLNATQEVRYINVNLLQCQAGYWKHLHGWANNRQASKQHCRAAHQAMAACSNVAPQAVVHCAVQQLIGGWQGRVKPRLACRTERRE